MHDAALLQLLHLSDSALPIGAAAHSFGLETLAEEGELRPEGLARFFHDHLEEAGAVEAIFVARAWRAGNGDGARSIALSLSEEFSARRPARESREGSLKLGRRFADLVNALARGDGPIIDANLHYPVAFGMVGRTLAIPENAVVLAYLQQSIAGLISACQRLMPLGQVAANRVLWNLKPAMIQAMAEATTRATISTPPGAPVVASSIEETSCFQPLPELASIRHGAIETRLFIS